MKKRLFLALALGSLLSASAHNAAPMVQEGTFAGPTPIRPVFGKELVAKSTFSVPMKAPAVSAADYAGRTFYGALITSDAWMDLWITEVPYGLYEMTIGDKLTAESKYTSMSANWMSGAVRDGRFYGIRAANLMGALTGVATTEIDLNTWTELRDEFADEVSFGKLPTTMTYDPTSGEILGVFYNDDLTGLNWVKFNTKTLEAEIICRFGGRFNVIALGVAPDATIYAVSTDGDLYTVNRSNARVSLVGNTGVNVAAYTQAMAWDATTNTFLWAAVTPTGNALYALDPEGPKTTLIKTFTDSEQFASLFFIEQTAMAGAPLAPADLKWNYSAPGALDGTVSFTVPTAGDVTVYLDGTAVKEGVATAAGATVSVPFTGLTNAMHHVSAVVKNETGWSPFAEKFSFAGLDVPLPVTDLTFAETDGVANVSWTAPAGGVENGYIDPEKLYYKVYRLPDSVLVADNLHATTFSETLPTGVKRYAYSVTPYNGADKQGETTMSNSLVYGQAYELPFIDDFRMEGALDVYEVIDGNGDNSTWNINPYGDQPLLACSVTYDQNSEATDDWILTPNISFEKGNLYRVTITMRNTWPGNPDLLSVGYCDSENHSKDGIKVVETLEVNTPSMTRLDHTVDFTVDADGDYKVSLGLVTPRGQGGGVFISKLMVEKVGSLDAPAAVADLTLTPDPSGASKATLTFTAPDKTLAGNTITGTMTAVIYRDGVEIGKVEGIAAGAETSWTDNTDPAPGKHTYTVRMANDAGEGNTASASAFVGVYKIPFVDPLDTRESIDYYTFIPVGFEDNELNSEMHFPSWGDPCLEVDHMNYSDEHQEMYVVFPLIEFDNESVYKVYFDIKAMSYASGEPYSIDLVYGDKPEADALTGKGFEISNPAGYDFETQEHLLVLTEGGQKYLAFHITAPTQGYLYLYLRNIRIEKEASALAPDTVTNVIATSDLISNISFNAPAVDYAGRALEELTKIEIFRNGSVVPIHTFESPKPGEKLEWIDADALQGFNTYLIVPTNLNGRGNPLTVTSFIGYDTPVAPAGLSIVPNPGNQTATITWETPERGVNGGVLDQEKMTFTLVKVTPAAADGSTQAVVDILETGITGNSVVPEREATENQELVYYGIATVTPQGISDPSIYFTILGKPYELPFIESFPDGVSSTEMWLNTGAAGYGLQAMPTSGDMLEYNGYPNTVQDGDNGVYLFLNGSYSDYPQTFAVLSPKMDLGNAADPQLSFWLYKGNQSGYSQTAPTFDVYASTNETDFYHVGGTTWTETSPAWVEYTYPLSQFVGQPGALIFQFNVTAGIMNDIVLMDNFRVESTTSVSTIGSDSDDCNVLGVSGGVLTRGALGSEVNVYTPAGLLVASFEADDNVHALAPGIYVATLSGRSFKIVVK